MLFDSASNLFLSRSLSFGLFMRESHTFGCDSVFVSYFPFLFRLLRLGVFDFDGDETNRVEPSRAIPKDIWHLEYNPFLSFTYFEVGWTISFSSQMPHIYCTYILKWSDV